MLVDYSDSEEDANVPPSARRQKLDTDKAATSLPSLPSTFHSLYATTVRTANVDDPELHGGRTRQVSHQEGNWSTHIYLEWLPSPEDTEALHDVIGRMQSTDGPTDSSREVHSFLRSGLGVRLPLHISLSAPMVLKTDNKNAFLEMLRGQVLTSGATAFDTKSNGIAWVPNLDQTRYFLVLQLSKPDNDDLEKLLRACNACASKFDLLQLYSNAGDRDRSSSFHISIAWALHKPGISKEEAESMPVDLFVPSIKTSFKEVKVKIGNVVTDIPLPAG